MPHPVLLAALVDLEADERTRRLQQLMNQRPGPPAGRRMRLGARRWRSRLGWLLVATGLRLVTAAPTQD